MPQASDELRKTIINWFGDIGESGPMRVLELRGWTLTRDWCWWPSVPSQTIHEIDWILMRFLVEEWDFGGVAKQ